MVEPTEIDDKSSMVARLQKETTSVDIFRTKGTTVFRALPSSFYHVFDALELIILLIRIAALLLSYKTLLKVRR